MYRLVHILDDILTSFAPTTIKGNEDDENNETNLSGIPLENIQIGPSRKIPSILKKKSPPTKPENMRSLPDFDDVKHYGEVKMDATKKKEEWNEAYWIAYGFHRILFFPNKDDFWKWVSDPKLTCEEANRLISHEINFKSSFIPSYSSEKIVPHLRGYTLSKITTEEGDGRDVY